MNNAGFVPIMGMKSTQEALDEMLDNARVVEERRERIRKVVHLVCDVLKDSWDELEARVDVDDPVEFGPRIAIADRRYIFQVKGDKRAFMTFEKLDSYNLFDIDLMDVPLGFVKIVHDDLPRVVAELHNTPKDVYKVFGYLSLEATFAGREQ
jgi:hypothetical protein